MKCLVFCHKNEMIHVKLLLSIKINNKDCASFFILINYYIDK